MGDAAAGMVTNYVSERFDGKSAQEAFQSTTMLLVGVAVGAFQSGLDSYLNQHSFVKTRISGWQKSE